MQVISLCSWWIVLFLIPHLSALLCLSPSLPYLLPLLPTVLSLLSLCILNPFPVSPSLPSVSHFPSIRCPNDYTGDRCENSVMAGFYSMSICSCLSPFPLRCCMLHWRGWMVEMLNVCVFNVTILFHWSRRVCVCECVRGCLHDCSSSCLPWILCCVLLVIRDDQSRNVRLHFFMPLKFLIYCKLPTP